MWLVAAEAPVQDSQTAIVLGAIALLTAVLVAVVGGVFTLLNTRASRTTSAAPAAPTQDLAFRDFVVGELAVTRQRLDDHDEDLAIKDRRHDQVERYLDLDNPNWRNP